MARPRVLSIVLAGGEGKRLMPLTMDRAKPAVPFGGTYRLIDYVLSNLANAGMRQIAVLTQYKSHSLDRHISLTWRMSTLLGNYVTPVPAQQRLGPPLVPGQRRRDLPVDELDHRRGPRLRRGLRRRQHLPDGRLADAGRPHRRRAGVHGGRHPGPAQPGHGLRGDRRGGGQQDQGLPGEAGRTAGAARRSRGLVRLDGQLHLHRGRADRGAEQPTPRTWTPGTTWAATSSRPSSASGEAQVYDFTKNSVPGHRRSGTRPTGATSGRSTRTTRRTWISSRSTRCSTCTTWTGRSGPIRCRPRARSSRWTGRPPTRSSARGASSPAASSTTR